MIATEKYGTRLTDRIAWAHKNLFNTWWNSLLTLTGLTIVGTLVYLLADYILFTANWNLVAFNRRLFFVGSYPADEVYRIWISVFLLGALASITYGIWVGRLKPFFIVAGVLAIVVLTFGLGSEVFIEETEFSSEVEQNGQTVVVQGVDRDLKREGGWAPEWLYALSLGLALPFGLNWIVMAALFITAGTGTLIGKYWLARWKKTPVLLQAIGAGWVLLIPITLLLQIGISANRWESVFLDMLVFVVGVFFSFFIGVALALGRTSPYVAVRASSVGYIEVVRAAPLIVWLLFATFLNDELGPLGEAFSNITLPVRVMIVFAFFGGAYIAEVMRGGLQSISRGQYEAAEAMGLNSVQKHLYIILPQAIRAVVPAIIGRFIALWKDTALLAVISLVNTLEKAKKILGGQNDLAEGSFFEVYILVGVIYWVVSYLLSRMGSTAEERLGAGEKR